MKTVAGLLLAAVLTMGAAMSASAGIFSDYNDYPNSITVPTRRGYFFDGYYTERNGNGSQIFGAYGHINKYATGYVSYSHGAGASTWWSKDLSDGYEGTASLNLYADWRAKTYNVTLNQNGGSGGTGSVTVTYDSAMPAITKPTRTGYTFQGYFDSASGGTKYYNTDGTSAKIWDKIEDTTLYAQWTPNVYNVTFDCNATNLLQDPSFESGAWTGGERSTEYVHSGGYSYKMTGTDSSPEFLAKTTGKITLNKDHIYYACVYAYQPTKIGYIACYWPIKEPSMGQITAKDAGKWNLYSWRVSRNTFDSGDYNLRFDFDNRRVIGNTYFDSAKLIDLTASFGVGNEPTKEWCDIHLSTTATYDSHLPTVTTPTKIGYNFEGYFDSASGGQRYYYADGVSAKIWDKTTNTTLYSHWEETWTNHVEAPTGEGTQISPYLISSPQNLAWMARQTEEGINFEGKYFKQTANIDLNSYIWKPIGNWTTVFAGNYNGNNYIISNLETSDIEKSNGEYLYDYQGLFGVIGKYNSLSLEIKNINLFNVRIKGLLYVGGIAGRIDYTTIESCKVYGVIEGYGLLGGVVGQIEHGGYIRYCYVEGQIIGKNGTTTSGGIVGWFHYSGEINSCAYINSDNSEDKNPYYAISDAYSSGDVNNCYAECNSKIKEYRVSSCLYVLNGVKKCFSTANYSAWIILNGKPMPSGLTWMGNVGTKVTNIEQIYALGYTSFKRKNVKKNLAFFYLKFNYFVI